MRCEPGHRVAHVSFGRPAHLLGLSGKASTSGPQEDDLSLAVPDQAVS